MNDNIRKILDDKAQFSFVVSVFLLSLFAFFLLVKNDLGAFFRADRTLKETRENLNMLANTIDYKDYISQFDSQFVGTGNANWLMEVLTELVDKKNVTLGSIKPIESYSVSGYRIIRVTAEGTAFYPDILGLLSDIEDYNKYICIERLEVGVGKEPAGSSGFFAGRGMMPPQMPASEPEARSAKFTLTIASLVREI